MIFLHRNLDSSLSRQVYSQVNFDLLLDLLVTFSSPYLLVFKLESVLRCSGIFHSVMEDCISPGICCTEKPQKFFLFVWSRQLYWCAVSISIWRRARTARLLFQRQARAVSFGPTNYEECLHRSEWESEWHICISESRKKLVSTLCVSTSLKSSRQMHFFSRNCNA